MLHLLKVSINGLEMYKTINIEEAFAKHLNSMPKDSLSKEMFDFYSTFCDKLTSFKNIKTSYCLNDSGDVMIRIKPKTDFA